MWTSAAPPARRSQSPPQALAPPAPSDAPIRKPCRTGSADAGAAAARIARTARRRRNRIVEPTSKRRARTTPRTARWTVENRDVNGRSRCVTRTDIDRRVTVASLATALADAVLASDHERARALAEE